MLLCQIVNSRVEAAGSTHRPLPLLFLLSRVHKADHLWYFTFLEVAPDSISHRGM